MSELNATQETPTGRKRRPKVRRRWPPLWLRILLAMPLLMIVWVRIADPAGDRGMVNVSSFLLMLLFLLSASPWFIFFSGYSRWLRFGLPLLGLAAIVLFFNLFRYQGVSGAMIPRFAFRLAGDGEIRYRYPEFPSQHPRPPIIDMHLHAQKVPPGEVEPLTGLRAPDSDEANMQKTLALLEHYNVIAVTSGPALGSGPPAHVKKWKAAAPERIIPGIGVFHFVIRLGLLNPDSLRESFRRGELAVLGEIATQYGGISPSDDLLEPFFALAEELDIPAGIHMGLGPPGVAYDLFPKYRASLGNPLLLEEVLLRHPKMRIYVMHAGWPMLDEMISLLYAHPQVYVDTGVISWILPRKEFHRYLRRIVEAGFGKRVMFGSDNVFWPDAIEIAIEAIESADFLTEEQKRDIFYNNATRFLRLKDDRSALPRP